MGGKRDHDVREGGGIFRRNHPCLCTYGSLDFSSGCHLGELEDAREPSLSFSFTLFVIQYIHFYSVIIVEIICQCLIGNRSGTHGGNFQRYTNRWTKRK